MKKIQQGNSCHGHTFQLDSGVDPMFQVGKSSHQGIAWESRPCSRIQHSMEPTWELVTLSKKASDFPRSLLQLVSGYLSV